MHGDLINRGPGGIVPFRPGDVIAVRDAIVTRDSLARPEHVRHGAAQYHDDGDPYRAMKRAYGITAEDVAQLRALGVEPEYRSDISQLSGAGRFAVVHRPSGREEEITPIVTMNLRMTVAGMFATMRVYAALWILKWAAVAPPDVWWLCE